MKAATRRTIRRHGLYYNRGFVTPSDRKQILDWLSTIHPIWEFRFSRHNPPPSGEEQRRLLRPVYWLGNWQFACLNYYHPPKGVDHRCVRAEPFPQILAEMVVKIEAISRRIFTPEEIPSGWHLNTCLVNFYGSVIVDQEAGEAGGEGQERKKIDTARVGEHKDFEPGPVASVSLGERALFQFVSSQAKGKRDEVVVQQWLDDGSLQIFGGRRWKSQLFHRVQRVDRRAGHYFDIHVPDFETRRVNFTFRYVPDRHIEDFRQLPPTAREDIGEYVRELARHSPFWAKV